MGVLFSYVCHVNVIWRELKCDEIRKWLWCGIGEKMGVIYMSCAWYRHYMVWSYEGVVRGEDVTWCDTIHVLYPYDTHHTSMSYPFHMTWHHVLFISPQYITPIPHLYLATPPLYHITVKWPHITQTSSHTTLIWHHTISHPYHAQSRHITIILHWHRVTSLSCHTTFKSHLH